MQHLTNDDGEVRELTEQDLAQFKPAHEVLPASLMTKLKKMGRPVSENPKIATTVRLSPEVVEYFKAGGKGWQTRLDTVLREYVATH